MPLNPCQRHFLETEKDNIRSLIYESKQPYEKVLEIICHHGKNWLRYRDFKNFVEECQRKEPETWVPLARNANRRPTNTCTSRHEDCSGRGCEEYLKYHDGELPAQGPHPKPALIPVTPNPLYSIQYPIAGPWAPHTYAPPHPQLEGIDFPFNTAAMDLSLGSSPTQAAIQESTVQGPGCALNYGNDSQSSYSTGLSRNANRASPSEGRAVDEPTAGHAYFRRQ